MLATASSADEGRLLAVGPEAQCFLRGADCTGFTAVLVDDDLGHFAVGAEAGFDEIDFGFHHGHVVLRAALEDEARAERGEIGNAGDVEEDVLREHIGEAGKDFF